MMSGGFAFIPSVSLIGARPADANNSAPISFRSRYCDTIGTLGSLKMQDLIGRTLGHYRIVEKIGEGGMGEVYRAHDERLDRDVAIKVLPPSVAQDPNRIGRFEREAKAIAKLDHPNILAIHDFGTEDDITYAVTELLDGETLREVISQGWPHAGKAVEYRAGDRRRPRGGP